MNHALSKQVPVARLRHRVGTGFNLENLRKFVRVHARRAFGDKGPWLMRVGKVYVCCGLRVLHC